MKKKITIEEEMTEKTLSELFDLWDTFGETKDDSEFALAIAIKKEILSRKAFQTLIGDRLNELERVVTKLADGEKVSTFF